MPVGWPFKKLIAAATLGEISSLPKDHRNLAAAARGEADPLPRSTFER
jgi:hypothetical protein